MDVCFLLQQLADANVEQRRSAAELCARDGAMAQAAVVSLVLACGDSDESVRQWASAAMEELGPPVPGNASALANLLQNESADVAYWAATLLGRLQAKAANAVAPLAQALAGHSAPAVRQRAAWALGQIGVAAKAARSALLRASQASDPRLARLASTALQSIDGQHD